jgi:hypothetical protein
MPVRSATIWHLPWTHYCWSAVMSTSSSGRNTGGSRSERDHGCEGGWSNNSQLKCSSCTLLLAAECEWALYGEAQHRMPVLHAFCPELALRRRLSVPH